MLGKLFHRLFERKSADAAFAALFDIGAATAANIAVTPEIALRCVPVYAGVRVRCKVLGSLPLHLYERRDDGGKDRATDHPLYRLLHDRRMPGPARPILSCGWKRTPSRTAAAMRWRTEPATRSSS